ncbi:MAG: lamin tail domain-containing protein [Mariprofundaceae bacterium]
MGGNLDAVFVNSFRVGLSNLVYKVFARNVVVLGYLITDHVMDVLEPQLETLRQNVANNPDHVMVSTGTALATTLSVRFVSDDTAREATQQLIVDLLAISQLAFGSSTWNSQRRETLRLLLLESLVGDDQDVDYRSSVGLDAFFRQVLECNHVPNADAVGNVAELLADVTLEQIKILVEYLPPAVASFLLALTAETVESMDENARAAIDAVAQAADEALRLAREYAEQAEEWKQQAELAVLLFAGQLDLVGQRFKDASLRSDILDGVHDFGITKVIEAVSANIPNWNSMSAAARGAALAVPLGAYETVFFVARPFLDTALFVLGTLSDDIADVIRQTTRVDDLVADLAAFLVTQVKDAVNRQINQFGLDLPDEISVQDVADIAKDALLTDELAAILRTAYGYASTEAEAKREQALAELEQSKQQEKQRERSMRLAGLRGQNPHVAIESPAGLDSSAEQRFIYGPLVPIMITIDGANLTFVETGVMQRVFLSINAQTLSFQATDWQESKRGIVYRTELVLESSPMQPGLNVLECSIADAEREIKRTHVSFVIDPEAPVLNSIEVLLSESQFDVPGVSDHQRTSEEYVSFINNGNALVLLKGWRIQDAASHRFVLPERSMMPGETLRVVTGAGTDTSNDIFLGESQAVWNNRGDSVYLVDGNNVLRTALRYPEPFFDE